MKTVKRLMLKLGFTTVILLFGLLVNAQDTIKVMHYNLLYYGKNVYDCSSVTNAVDAKNGYLKTIIKHVKPDIFTVNELDGEDAYPITNDATYLLNNAMNVDGVTYYSRTSFPKTFLANTLFYNSQKLKLKKHTPISFTISNNKVFNAYTLYYNSPDLSVTNDTVFITCVIAHFKAGSYSSDIEERTAEAGIVMDFFTSLGVAGNYLFLGDLNLYTSTEGAFQKLINPGNPLYKLYDPANQIGDWNNNSAYRFVHTQSTHTSGDCYSSGGMDDRFDFILASDYIMNGTQKVKYVPGSYKAVGQDGSSFNSSLNVTSNTSVPSNVAMALYNMSDHLPVYLELKIDQTSVSDLNISNIYTNPTNPNSAGVTTIYATLTDIANKVDQMKILWGNTPANYPNRVSMTALGNVYSGPISQFPAGTNIYYKIAGYNSSDEIAVLSDEKSFTVANPLSVEFIENTISDLKISTIADEIVSVSGKLVKNVILKIEMISLSGEIMCIKTHSIPAGVFEIKQPIEDITNGIYLIRISSEDFIISEKVIVQ
jgi:hypothetical protein